MFADDADKDASGEAATAGSRAKPQFLSMIEQTGSESALPAGVLAMAVGTGPHLRGPLNRTRSEAESPVPPTVTGADRMPMACAIGQLGERSCGVVEHEARGTGIGV